AEPLPEPAPAPAPAPAPEPEPEPEPLPEPAPEPAPAPEPEPEPEPVPAAPHREAMPAPEDPAPAHGDPFATAQAPAVAPEDDWLQAGEPEVVRIQPDPPAPPPAPAGTLPPQPEAALGATRAPRVSTRGRGAKRQRPIASPPGDAPVGVRRARRWRRPVAIGFLLLVLVGVLWLLNALIQPFGGEGEGRVTVRIPEGSSARDIGDQLDEAGVIDSGAIFALRAMVAGKRDDLRSGRHVLAEGMSYSAAITALTTVPKAQPAPTTVKIAIPEGLSRREIAARVQKTEIEGSYLAATERAPAGFSPRKYGAPRRPRSLEGFLFPATYELRPSQTVRSLVRQQLDTFEQNIATVSMRRARARNLTTYDVLIIASMVEREAQLAKERRTISAVIHNRLREGMPLGIDATTRYATNNCTRPLRQSELNADSAYNTRRNTGLPPTPIGNPGLASIKAAANPSASKALYYVVKPGTCGEHAFSSTEAQFQRDVQRYNEAREQAGGKSPTTC
ncbi:MAG: endolytic transglycosylase MltG, partial [Baekduiaceae bacterium]